MSLFQIDGCSIGLLKVSIKELACLTANHLMSLILLLLLQNQGHRTRYFDHAKAYITERPGVCQMEIIRLQLQTAAIAVLVVKR